MEVGQAVWYDDETVVITAIRSDEIDVEFHPTGARATIDPDEITEA